MSIASIQSKYPSAIWYDSAHSGTESGTVDEPYNTLDEAMTAASSGGVIAIKDGTHSEDAQVTLPKSLTFVGESTNGAILSTSGSGKGAAFTATAQTYSITLETLTVTHTGTAHLGLIYGGSSGNVTIDTCVIDMSAVGAGTARGFIGFDTATATGQTITCIDSVIFTGATNGGYLAYFFPPNVDFQRNTIYVLSGSTASSAIQSGAGGTVTWKNNILNGNGQSETLNFTLDTASNNCYYNTGISSGSGGTVFADPQFVDAANGDLRLRPSSPCIGAGTAS